MILKTISKSGATSYMAADEFIVHKISVKNVFKDFKSEYQKSDIGYYKDKYNFLIKIIQEKTNMDNQVIEFRTSCEFEDLDLICCIYPKTKAKEYEIIATNQMTFLMSEEGKTIERLI